MKKLPLNRIIFLTIFLVLAGCEPTPNPLLSLSYDELKKLHDNGGSSCLAMNANDIEICKVATSELGYLPEHFTDPDLIAYYGKLKWKGFNQLERPKPL